ncbi:MAG: Do family serine endopeptidase [Candidatus Omnitrophota bacterium]|nr:Do family serine endopeptidase [Candidatus Omnitrophota bacterium]
MKRIDKLNNKSLFLIIVLVSTLIIGISINRALSGDVEQKTAFNRLDEGFTLIARDVYPAVVSITSTHIEKLGAFGYKYSSPFGEDDLFDQFFKDFFGQMPEREYKQIGIGSGVIVDKDGYILTNYHVVEGVENGEVTVKLPDGREFKGKIKGVDSRSDLAIVKIDGKDLPVARLGNSDNVKIGQWAVAIGNPFGFIINDPNPTMTVGVISALHRSLPAARGTNRYYGDLIQTDAAINRGNSGGPLVNIKGEIIGINVAIFSTTGGYQGVGFAIPVNTAKDVVNALISGKEVLYGWLGVNVQDIDQVLADYFRLPDRKGVLVAKVLKDSPAERGGIKDKDIIRIFDGKEITDTRQLIKIVNRTSPDKKVLIKVIRNNKEEALRVKIGKRPDTLKEVKEKVISRQLWRGLKVSDITPEISRMFSISQDVTGVVIVDIEYGSPADESGLRKGDVITQIGPRAIDNLTGYKQAITGIKGSVLIKIDRGYFVIKEDK